MEKEKLKKTLSIIGGIIVLIAMVKFSVIGFRRSELIPYLIILIVGTAIAYIGAKIKIDDDDYKKAKKPDMWICKCGAINRMPDSYCGDCGAHREN